LTAANRKPVVVLISANAEWIPVKEYYKPSRVEKNPYGEYFQEEIKGRPVIFQYGGWGKIAAAASAEMAVNRWDPEVIINPGTCGGFAGQIERGAILMPDRTLSYDIIEQMGDPQEAIEAYTTLLDNSWLKQPYPLPVQSGIIVSGDRDIVPDTIPGLIAQYQARAADWESASIAWVAAKKHNRHCLILRGVTDLVYPQGGEAYGGMDFFEQASRQIMDRLCGSLPGWLGCAGY
jgi:adenosylhomocysteine nucleosidase